MKIANIIKVLPFLVFMLSACVDDEILMPIASAEVAKTIYAINESVVFNFTGEAKQVSIFTGDNSHNYDLLESGNTGFVVNKQKFSYAYKQPGTYKVVIIASNYSEGAAEILKDTCSLTIQVIDDDVTIKSLSCPKVLYDEVAARSINDTDWLVCLPQKILFTAKVATITSKQRLFVKLASDSTLLLVNGTKFNATTTYELSSPVALNLTAHSGNVKDYTLYMLRFPEFLTFRVAGVNGTFVRSEFNYDKMTMAITVPAGTDRTALIPEFTLSQGQEVFVNDVLQTSGVSAVDFTSPVVFRIKNTFDGKPHLSAETEVTVSIVI